jgi:hypothetical protein
MGGIKQMGKPALLSQKYQDLEKAVFEITEKFGEKEFDHIQLLREVFKRGLNLTQPTGCGYQKPKFCRGLWKEIVPGSCENTGLGDTR